MADTTGQGKLPVGSKWVQKSGQLYASPVQDVADIWNDWLFDGIAPSGDDGFSVRMFGI
jgi:hypothetical protein